MAHRCLLSFLCCLALTTLRAQDGLLDPTFDPGTGCVAYGSHNRVKLIAAQDDGNVVIAGEFVQYDRTGRRRIARIRPDGALDDTFDPGSGADSYVDHLRLLPDGKFLLAGSFHTYADAPRSRVVRINPDGSPDLGFDTGTGPDNTVHQTAVQPDGRILLAGVFSDFDGAPAPYVMRLNADGSRDASFDTGTGPNSFCYAVVLQPDGRPIVSGTFNQFNGTPRRGLVRLNANGSLDASFDPGEGPDNVITNIALQPDGKILIAGMFEEYDGVPCGRIARLNADGSLDASFAVGTGANGEVSELLQLSDGDLVLTGDFTSFNGTTVGHLVRLQANGTLDAGFDPGTGADDWAIGVAALPDGHLLVGGEFQHFDGSDRRHLACLDATGALAPDYVAAEGVSDGWADALALQPDGRVLVSGEMTEFNGTPRRGLVRLLADGSVDPDFDPGIGATSTASTSLDCIDCIDVILVQPDGHILVGGVFTGYGGVPRGRIARLMPDGTLDTSFDPGTGITSSFGAVYSIALQPDGRILLAGFFSAFNGQMRHGLARLFADGSLDPTFAPDANNTVAALCLDPDGKVLVGGAFTTINGVARNRIARLHADGTLDTSFDPGDGADGITRMIQRAAGGGYIVAGEFTAYDGEAGAGIVRIQSDGSRDATFDTGTGTDEKVMSVIQEPDGRYLITGMFTSYDGTPRGRIARLSANGSLDTDFDPGSGADGFISGAALDDAGQVLISGRFLSYDGTPVNGVARLVNNTVAAVPALHAPATLGVHPNPTTGRVRLSRPAGAAAIEVFDVQGRCLQHAPFAEVLDLNATGPLLLLVRDAAGKVLARQPVVVE